MARFFFLLPGFRPPKSNNNSDQNDVQVLKSQDCFFFWDLKTWTYRGPQFLSWRTLQMLFHLKPQPCFPLLKLRSERFFPLFSKDWGFFLQFWRRVILIKEMVVFQDPGSVGIFLAPGCEVSTLWPRWRSGCRSASSESCHGWGGGRWKVWGNPPGKRPRPTYSHHQQRGREVRKLNRQTNMCWFGKRLCDVKFPGG